MSRSRNQLSIVVIGLLLGGAGGVVLHLAATDKATLSIASPAFADDRSSVSRPSPMAKSASPTSNAASPSSKAVSPASNAASPTRSSVAAPPAGQSGSAAARLAPSPAARAGMAPSVAGGSSTAPMANPATKKAEADRGDLRRYQREPYYYGALGRRDPFSSLLEGDFQAAGDAGLVDLGNIKLVGIAWDEIDQFAMVEDGRGFGFVLRTGDAIRGGKVLKIDRESVTFVQTTAGVSNTVTIDLPTRESE